MSRLTLTTPKRLLRRIDNYVTLLVLILLTLVVLPMTDAWEGARVITALLVTAIAVVTVDSADLPPWIERTVVVLGGAAVFHSVVVIVRGESGLGWAAFVLTLLLLPTPVIVLWRLLQHPVITMHTLAGALCVYLLLGLVFATAYQAIFTLDRTSFISASPLDRFSLVYYSYVVLTTLGFGDITMVNDAGRALTVLEAVIGQVVLVTLVARMVSSLGAQRHEFLARAPAGSSPAGDAGAGSVDAGGTAPDG